MGFADLVAPVLGWCSVSGRANQYSCLYDINTMPIHNNTTPHNTTTTKTKKSLFSSQVGSFADLRSANRRIGSGKLIAVIFFAATLIGTWSYDRGFGDHVVTSLAINGSNDENLPYPQITLCPFEDGGAIQNARCFSGHRLANGSRQGGPLLTFPIYDKCVTMNRNGSIPNSADYGVFCQVNATSAGTFHNKNYTWPGRVLVWVHEPGKDPRHCTECIDGPNAVIVQSGSTGFIGWQAHVYDVFGVYSIDYRTTSNFYAIPPVFHDNGMETSDMDFAMFYYTPDVLFYREPYALAAAIGGEQFGKFIVLVGAAGVVSYSIWWFIKTLLILLLLGKDALAATGGERDPLVS
jgi:hypothetical protein